MERVAQSKEFLLFAGDKFADRYMRPPADDRGDILFVNLLLEQPFRAVLLGQGILPIVKLLLKGGNRSVPQFRRLAQIILPFCPLQLTACRFEFLPEFLQASHFAFLALPPCPERGCRGFHFGEFLLQSGQTLAGRGILLLFESLDLDFELHLTPQRLVELHRARVHLCP